MNSNNHLPSTSLIHRGKKNRKRTGGERGGGNKQHVLLEGSLHDSAGTLDSIDIIPAMIGVSSSSMHSLNNNSSCSIISNHDSLDAFHSFHDTTSTGTSYNRCDNKSLSLSTSYHHPTTTTTTTTTPTAAAAYAATTPPPPPPPRSDYDQNDKKKNAQKRLHQRNTIRPSQKRQLLASVPNIPYNFYGDSSNKDNDTDDDFGNEKNENSSSSNNNNSIFSQRHRSSKSNGSANENSTTDFMFRILKITSAFTLIILLMFVGGFIIELATRRMFDQAGSTTRSKRFIQQQQQLSQQQQEQQRSGPVVPTAPRTATVTEELLQKLKEDSRIHESELHALQEELSKVKEHEHKLEAELTGLRLNQLTSQNNLRGGTGAPAGASSSSAATSAESDSKSDTDNNVTIMKDDYNPYHQNPGERYIHLLNRSPSPIQLFWINQEHVLDEEQHLVEWVVVETSSATIMKTRVTTLENGDEIIIQEEEGQNLILPGTTYHFHARPNHRFAIERAGSSENSHGSIKDHLFFDVPDDDGHDDNSDGGGGDVDTTNGDDGDPLVIVTESWELDIQRI